MNNPEATAQALDILRSGDAFQWYVIPMLALVMYVYANEYAQRNWKPIAAGLGLSMSSRRRPPAALRWYAACSSSSVP